MAEAEQSQETGGYGKLGQSGEAADEESDRDDDVEGKALKTIDIEQTARRHEITETRVGSLFTRR